VASIYKTIHFRDIHFTYDLLRDVAELKGDLVKEVMYAMEMVQSVDSAILKNREDSLLAGRLYTYTGIAYSHAAIWDRAVFFVQKGWAALQMTEWDSEYFEVAARLCFYLIHEDSAKEALQIVQTALHDRFLSGSYNKVRIVSALGNCYWALGDLEKAEAEFSTAARILNTEDLDVENPRHLQWKQEMIILIGNFYLSTHQYIKAKYYANRLPTNYTYVTTLRQRVAIELFRSRVDSAMGQYHSALKHFATYRLMNDSLFGIQKTIQIQELQMKNALDKKDNDIHLQGANISLLTKENELQQMQAGKSRTLRNMMIIALMFLAFLVALIYNRYRVKQQKNSQLELKQNEITIKNHQLEQLLQENKWLLQEVHHRVKNNLQTVTSLLTSQMASTETGPALDAIRESRQRIEAIAMIHQRLYKSSNFNSIALPAYIADLVEHSRVAFRPGPRIVFSLLTEPIVLDISAALPVGLILNEAISNALKHAFPGNMQGTIVISVCKVSEGKVMLEVRDDGIGFSESSEISGKSFGIRLIKGLVSDISGETEIINDNGTIVRVLFSFDHLDSGQNMLVEEM
jgi:two-component sensor histidine kinase